MSDTKPGRSSKKRRSAEATRAAICAAARAQFAERGFRATTIDAIAQRAGVTKSLIHHHVGNKRDLWVEVKRELFGRYLEAQRALVTSRPPNVDLFEASIRTYFQHLRENPEMVRLMSWMHLEGDETFEDVSEGLMGLSMQVIEAGQAAGLVRRDVEPFVMLCAFFSMVEHWFPARADYRARHDPGLSDAELDERYLEGITRIMGAGLRPPGRSEQP